MQEQMRMNRKSTLAATDVTLWETIIAGNEISYAKFMKHYAKPLFNYGYRLCNDKDFLKDCIQDLFIDIWHRRSSLSFGENFKWYLFKSLRNNILRELSKSKINQPLADNYDFMVEFDAEHLHILSDSEQELTHKVKKTLDDLPPRQKEVLYLRYFEGLVFDEIALIMDINKQSSHNLLQKAYKTFREKWEINTESAVASIIITIFSS